MSYSTDDATAALFRFYLDQGYEEYQINQPSRHGYDDDYDGYAFANRNAEGEVQFEVHFSDDDGNAVVSFPDGASGSVNIREEDEDDDEEDEDLDA